MRYYKNNVLTITSTTGKKIVGLTFVASSSSYVDELEVLLTALGYEYTKVDTELTITVEAAESIVLTNSSSKNCRISAIKVIYEK
jgi:uncharacterized alpha/beta hydrolase family protein